VARGSPSTAGKQLIVTIVQEKQLCSR